MTGYFRRKIGRGERIRTSDPSVPNRVLYQAEPRPDRANAYLNPDATVNATVAFADRARQAVAHLTSSSYRPGGNGCSGTVCVTNACVSHGAGRRQILVRLELRVGAVEQRALAVDADRTCTSTVRSASGAP